MVARSASAPVRHSLPPMIDRGTNASTPRFQPRALPLVSIVVPAYNARRYIARCLRSLVSQSYKNIEVVCVDDCSDDGTIKILERFAQQDPRVVVIASEKNEGTLQTRTKGYKKAKGDYITAVDTDDCLTEDIIAQSVECALITKSDLVHFQTMLVQPDGTRRFYKWAKPNDDILSPDSASSLKLKDSFFADAIAEETISHSHCGKLVKASALKHAVATGLLDNFYFTVWEDLVAWLVISRYITSYATLNVLGYYYYTRSDSVSRGFTIFQQPSVLTHLARFTEWLKDYVEYFNCSVESIPIYLELLKRCNRSLGKRLFSLPRQYQNQSSPRICYYLGKQKFFRARFNGTSEIKQLDQPPALRNLLAERPNRVILEERYLNSLTNPAHMMVFLFSLKAECWLITVTPNKPMRMLRSLLTKSISNSIASYCSRIISRRSVSGLTPQALLEGKKDAS